MVQDLGLLDPRKTVEAFVEHVWKGRLDVAWRLLTSPERVVVPLEAWETGTWDSTVDAELKENLAGFEAKEPRYIDDRRIEAHVDVAFYLKDRDQLAFSFRTRREADGWHVYLGLDRPTGVWTL